jgi:hypothetical protein
MAAATEASAAMIAIIIVDQVAITPPDAGGDLSSTVMFEGITPVGGLAKLAGPDAGTIPVVVAVLAILCGAGRAVAVANRRTIPIVTAKCAKSPVFIPGHACVKARNRENHEGRECFSAFLRPSKVSGSVRTSDLIREAML